MSIFSCYLYLWERYVCRCSQLAPIRSRWPRDALQHIYKYRCKNSTIGFIITIFKVLFLSIPEKRFKSLDYNVF